MWRSLFTVLLIGATGYVLIVALVYLTQDRLVYFPSAGLVTTPDEHGLVFEDVELTAADGVGLHGWFLPAAEPRGTLLFLHGNAGNISHRIESLRQFQALDLSVFILSYRGYGRSGGRPSEQGLQRDALAAWHYLREDRGVPASRVVVFGRSLGAAVAAQLTAQLADQGADRDTPAAVILESAFTGASDLGAELYPWLPVRLLIRDAYDVRAAVAAIEVPILIAHSRDDEIVPFVHARELQAAAGPDTPLLVMQGGHNDAFLRTGAAYIEGIQRFLQEQLPGYAGDS